jgi:hypothetical protein
MTSRPIAEFDGFALFAAMDAQRLGRSLSWRGVADEIWALSAVLNARRHDHPISPSTLSTMATRGATSCQHALFILRWLDRTPESFLVGHAPTSGAPLPVAGPDRRLRWNLKALHAALDEARREASLTWAQLAKILRCTPSQLTGLRTAKFAANMAIAMRCVQWLGRPAADFVYVAQW